MSRKTESTNKSSSLHVLGLVKQAISTLDLKGTDDTVTKSMEIISRVEDCLRSGLPVEGLLLANELNLQDNLLLNNKVQS